VVGLCVGYYGLEDRVLVAVELLHLSEFLDELEGGSRGEGFGALGWDGLGGG